MQFCTNWCTYGCVGLVAFLWGQLDPSRNSLRHELKESTCSILVATVNLTVMIALPPPSHSKPARWPCHRLLPSWVLPHCSSSTALCRVMPSSPCNVFPHVASCVHVTASWFLCIVYYRFATPVFLAVALPRAVILFGVMSTKCVCTSLLVVGAVVVRILLKYTIQHLELYHSYVEYT